MANTAAPRIPLELDKPRTLQLDFNALASYEDVTGDELLSGWAPTTAKQIRALLWAALLHEDPELTLLQVGAMIHSGNMQQISEALKRASDLAMPTASSAGTPAGN